METFDQEQWRNEQAFFAYYATQGKPEYLQDGYWVFKDYLGPRVEVTDVSTICQQSQYRALNPLAPAAQLQ